MRSIWLRARLDTAPRFCGLEIGNAVPHRRQRGIPKRAGVDRGTLRADPVRARHGPTGGPARSAQGSSRSLVRLLALQLGLPDCAPANHANARRWLTRASIPIIGSGMRGVRRHGMPGWDRWFANSPLEGDGFELPVPGRIYSAAMRSQVISRCSSTSPVWRGGGTRTMRSPTKRTPRT